MRAKSARSMMTLLAVVASASVTHADQKADALLRKVEAVTRSVQTLTADVTTINRPLPGNKYAALPGAPRQSKYVGRVELKRPNLARIKQTRAGGPYATMDVSDGKTLWSLALPANEVYKSPVQPDGANIPFPRGWPSFFDADFAALVEDAGGKTRYLGKQKISGKEYRVVEIVGLTQTVRYYIGPDTLVHRVQADLNLGDAAQQVETVYANIRVNVPLARAAFAFEPPKGAQVSEAVSLEANMLPIGANAPDFQLPTPGGGDLRLSEAREGKQATLVSLWSYG